MMYLAGSLITDDSFSKLKYEFFTLEEGTAITTPFVTFYYGYYALGLSRYLMVPSFENSSLVPLFGLLVL